DAVSFVEDDEVVLEQNAALNLVVQAAQQRKEQRVVQHQHIGREDAAARALKKTDAVLLAELGGVTANLGRTNPALGADVGPDFRIRLDVEIGQTALVGLLRPLVDAPEFLRFRRGEQAVGLLHGLVQTAGAEIIS